MATIQIELGEDELRRLIDGDVILFTSPLAAVASVELALKGIDFARAAHILRQARNDRAMADGQADRDRQAGRDEK